MSISDYNSHTVSTCLQIWVLRVCLPQMRPRAEEERAQPATALASSRLDDELFRSLSINLLPRPLLEPSQPRAVIGLFFWLSSPLSSFIECPRSFACSSKPFAGQPQEQQQQEINQTPVDQLGLKLGSSLESLGVQCGNKRCGLHKQQPQCHSPSS